MFEFKTQLFNKDIEVKIGMLARQSNGSVLLSSGDTYVLSTVVYNEPTEVPESGEVDVLPLTVEYREKTFATGKFPGGFVKREGKPSVKEILTCRLIDRPLRPLLPENLLNEIQVASFVLSADKENDPDIIAMNSAILAIRASGLPISNLISSVRVALIDGKFILNPSYDEWQKSSIDLVVSGTRKSILMVEGVAKEVTEKTLIDALDFAHKNIQTQLDFFEHISEKLPPPRTDLLIYQLPQELYTQIKNSFFEQMIQTIKARDKKSRRESMRKLKMDVENIYLKDETNQQLKYTEYDLAKAMLKLEEEALRKVVAEGKRIDGRSFSQIREVSCQVGVLPRTHGSALFRRGETEALVVTTLGTPMDEQIVDTLFEDYSKKFMLHYNFLPFSVGEVRPYRAPGRREIGHGNLAERALESVIPSEDVFPYTIRVVSDILESNGSSSMATVCGGTLSLMDAGIPIKNPVAGIAMGLVQTQDSSTILTDIQGTEDKCGDMDFKVAGTNNGITAFQMDLKTSEGISQDILCKALTQAKSAKEQLLEIMSKTIPQPRKDISIHAPRLFSLNIDPEKVGLLIGTGGKTIKKIQEKTDTTISIDEDGKVVISAKNLQNAKNAIELVESITEEAKIGKIYNAKVVAIKDFGVFVELPNGQEGLIHISELSNGYVHRPSDVVSYGQEISVKVIGIDEQNRLRLSRKQAMQTETQNVIQKRRKHPSEK